MHDQWLQFPTGFLWGTASAAHQVEGHNTNNDWWAFEQQPGAIWHGERSGAACNWWLEAEQDFDRMAQMGLNTHRLSIEWSRIEPQEGLFDAAALARYRAMLLALHQRAIEPMVTLFHFSTPQWLAKKGGWRNPAVMDYFRRFVRHSVEELGDLVRLWCTINEPNVYAAFGYLFGEHAPGEKSVRAYFQVLRHQLLAHAAAYRVIHALDGRAQVGLVINLQIFQALDATDHRAKAVARLLDTLFNGLTLNAVVDGRLRWPLQAVPLCHGPLVDSIDFMGLNYYSRQRVCLEDERGRPGRIQLRPTPGAEISDCGHSGTYGEVYPEGMYQALRRVARLGKPIYVTENGLPDADDDQRPRFLLTHLAQVFRALRDGIDVRGYYHWAFTDNFEWAEGWGLRFGLLAFDPVSGQRIPRPSAALFAEIARANGISAQMVEAYAPEVENVVLEL